MEDCDSPTNEIEDWTDYGDPEWVPLGPKLSSYFLHTVEWREAFLERLVAVGAVALIEAATRVYDLLSEPKDYRCARIAQAGGVSGSGKIAVVNALQAYLDEWLQLPSLIPASSFDDLEGWHAATMAKWASEQERERWVVRKFRGCARWAGANRAICVAQLVTSRSSFAGTMSVSIRNACQSAGKRSTNASRGLAGPM